jgi:tripartite-type tricarboxylate transporter receptor subunit TctC
MNLPHREFLHLAAGAAAVPRVTTSERSEALPDIPTVAETMPGYEAGMSLHRRPMNSVAQIRGYRSEATP